MGWSSAVVKIVGIGGNIQAKRLMVIVTVIHLEWLRTSTVVAVGRKLIVICDVVSININRKELRMKVLNEIQQKLVCKKGQTNKFGGYKYRSCEDILEAVKPLLGAATLTISDEMVLIGERYYIKATATLRNGQEESVSTAFARESESKKGMDASQITGSTSSYARKYALNGLFCIDDTKDADTQEPTSEKPKAPAANKRNVAQNKVLKALKEYYTSNAPQGKQIDAKRFEQAVFDFRGKWPSTKSGLETVEKELDKSLVYKDAPKTKETPKGGETPPMTEEDKRLMKKLYETIALNTERKVNKKKLMLIVLKDHKPMDYDWPQSDFEVETIAPAYEQEDIFDDEEGF